MIYCKLTRTGCPTLGAAFSPRRRAGGPRLSVIGAFLALAITLSAQQPGTVLFSTDQTTPTQTKPPATHVPDLTAADRGAITISAYDLDVHLTPAEAALTVRARITLRNEGSTPLKYLPLQLSSTLTWESIALDGKPVTFAQHLLDTDADHTGKASEAVITLPRPLASKESLTLTAFYSGTIPASAERLERIGAPLPQAAAADWDAITPQLTALRGFGNVLWYPVAAEPVFLGEGAKLFQAVGEQRLLNRHAAFHLRLAVQYIGDPPDAAILNGQRQPLAHVTENADVPAAEAPGTASVDFPTASLGFRSPSLFVTDRAPTVTDDTLIAAVTDHYDALPSYAAAAALAKPLLTGWLGPQPLLQLSLIDHPGQPFEDDALLVLSMRAVPAATLAPSLVHNLAHAWFRSVQPWLDEGVPQLLSLLWTEQSQGREAALESLQQSAKTLSLAEPADPSLPGQPLTVPRDDIFYRTKAAAVLWQLRTLATDDALRQTFLTYRNDAKLDADPEGFESALEKFSHKDLRWFFDDWIYSDRGLPDLTIENVTPRELATSTAKPGAKSGGWLVSVTVRNEGDAVADVPVTVRSGTLTATERLRIAAGSTASTRILFETTPEEVLVNDGSVPELRTSQHAIQIKPRSQ